MISLYILGHLGLGDHILCNGLVRAYAKSYDLVQIPCYLHNYQSVDFMFRDLKNVQAIAVDDDKDAIRLSKDKNCLKLGYFSEKPFNPIFFDKEFYSHANLPFQTRWDGFHVDLNESPDFKDHADYSFVHDDPDRGFVINTSHVDLEIIKPVKNGHIFHNYNLIKNASQIHCINSSFLIFVDSLPDVDGQELFLHKYSRPTSHPTLKRDWKML